ncbi:MAG: M48 family metallopeptidase [Luteolibacter sp.]
MDFFRAQENARRTSRWLVWWFMLCVLGVVTVIYLMAVVFLGFVAEDASDSRAGYDFYDPGLFLVVTVVIGGLIVSGSLYKLIKLSAGGAVVARDLGGREVDRLTTDFNERRLLNVVEEMSIAAGTPMPGVWVMNDEKGINAFAAGTDPANAVIGVTRGTLERLTRDELQGVIAHEFSHILNGDMRLNMRLTGWIFGLLMVVILGRMVLELARHAGRGRSRESGGIALVALLIGVSIWLVGTIGAFFARWIQAAVSRQREYLADASAVQFTRNPSGLADALRKVGGGWQGGAIQAAAASEARHLFFARSDLMQFSMATHPPIEKRIKAVFPQWDGSMLESRPANTAPEAKHATSAGFPGMPPPLPKAAGALGDHGILGPVLGAMMAEELASQNDGAGMRSKDDAKALVHGILLAEDKDLRLQGIELITARQAREIALRAAGWHDQLHAQTSAAKLAWIDQSLPWLKQMDRAEAEAFIATNRALIEADGEVNLFEFMLEQVIDRNVAIGTGLRQVSPMRNRTLEAVEHEIAVLIGIFTMIGGGAGMDEAARNEYREHTGRDLPYLPPDACSLAAVAEALLELDAATPLIKSRLLRMCGLIVSADGVIEDQETELLRAVADAIGAPMPRVNLDAA